MIQLDLLPGTALAVQPSAQLELLSANAAPAETQLELPL